MRCRRNRLLATALSATIFAHGAIAQERPKITAVSYFSILATDPAKTEFFFVHDLGA